MSNPMTDEEINETKDTLLYMSCNPSVKTKVRNYIKKGLELIVRLQVENIRLEKRVSYYKTKYEEIKNKEK